MPAHHRLPATLRYLATRPARIAMSQVADLMLNVLASFAQFEKALIAERVRAGMARAKRQGVHVGRPAKLNGNLDALRPAIEAGMLSRSAAARQLGVTLSAVSRALKKAGATGAAQTRTMLEVTEA
jgi:DNA invertase Pin-like site-specific DNA recombinase